ncbi:putative alpha-actinin [Histomonas meleagridis]|uniref:putative alpha-actinin n=1 Tax=Histomonas meleagridis TaxID=135588 RepID=UPI00355A1D6E|nr:putative alpha-actinin [Histomonas meleagridis]KAH0801185.1 putative alpha-actinin [Histomonas meleagridis]
MTILDKGWERTQIKVFSRWCAKHLRTRGIKFEDVTTEFEDGVKLIQLLEIIGKEPVKGKWHRECKNKYHKIENVNMAIQYIKDKGIKLTNIQADDIVDKNLKLTLGLTWSCINKFQIEDISVEEATARDALLIWCKKNTQGYDGVNITNFTTSWSSGLAFCALINHFRPELLDYNSLDKENHADNCKKAFEACEKLGITVFLDVEDLVDTTPDDKSVVTQVSEFFHFFASETKVLALAEKAKKIVGIQKQIDELKNNYAEQAKAFMDALNEAKNNLLADDYEQTVPSVKDKLVKVVKFGRDERPKLVELRGTAIRTWTQLVSNCNSHNRQIPTPPEGLEPETLTKALEETEQIQGNRSTELKEILHNLQKSKIDEFNEKCDAIANKCNEIREKSEQEDILNDLLEEAKGLSASELQAPYDELVQLQLNTRAKYTVYSIQSEIDQLVSLLTRLIDQKRARDIEKENKAKIDAYNEKAQVYVQESQDLKASLEIEGELEQRREHFINKIKEITEKREGVNNLNEDYHKLEQESLHLEIENTPQVISSMYAGVLAQATNSLNEIYNTMVQNYDAKAAEFIERIKPIETSAKELDGSLEDKKQKLEELLGQAQAIPPELEQLDAPFEELTQYKLNYKAKASPTDVRASADALVATINHLIQHNEGEIIETRNSSKISEYNEKANAILESAKALEASLDGLPESNEEKLTALFEKQKEVEAEKDKVEEILPLYEELEKDSLEIEVENSPSAISQFFANTLSHIKTLIQEADKAIAAAKGLEISEEQLNEFRETFDHFDKDKSKTLEPYELNACLTSLGETSTEDECKEIIKKYTGGQEKLDFDNYVKYMLDRFSKAESADATKEAFRAIAQNSPIINDEQLARYFSPEDAEYLKSVMTPVEGGYDFQQWVDSIYQ